MLNPLIRKLETYHPLSDADRSALQRGTANTFKIGARQDLIREGEDPGDILLILKGFACRYKLLSDGGRQIIAYLLPGDHCDLRVFVPHAMDHSIGTLSACTVARMRREALAALTRDYPRLAYTLGMAVLADEATSREWLVNVGRRPADQRIAHLFCELLRRCRAASIADGSSFEFPLTQQELGDTMGLSTVHVNRVLQRLRHDGLIALEGRRLEILDLDALDSLAGFNPDYLHLKTGRPSIGRLDQERMTA